jgi:hypothetical protein
MSISHTWSLALQARGNTFSYSKTLSNEGTDSRDVVIPSSGHTPHEVNIDWVNSKLQSILISSTVNVTLQTNSSSVPDTEISILANVPLIWYVGNYLANPFAAADVTSLFFTVPTGAVDAEVTIELLEDAT